MRSLLILSAFVLPSLASAAPGQLVHQGRLFDADGAPLDGPLSLTVGLYADASSTSALWEETQTAQFDNGYFSVVLGSSNPVSADAFNGGMLYAGLTVDGTVIPQRVPLASVPYALSATNVKGGSVDASSVAINGTTVIGSDGKVPWAAIADAPAGSDTLGDLACSPGQTVSFDGSDWVCDDIDVASEFSADAITSGTFTVARLPVGSGADQVAAGNHTHDAAAIVSGTFDAARIPGLDAAKITTGTIDAARLPSTLPDGSAQNKAAYNCEAVLTANPRAASGEYWIDPKGNGPFKARCDMVTAGGGWIDVVGTMHIAGQDVPGVGGRFFKGGRGTITITAASNVSNVKGVLIVREGVATHDSETYLRYDDLRFSDVQVNWRMQGSDDGNRCATGNWIPLNGPGYNGGYAGYLAPCPNGFTCIQGQPTDSRDAPVTASYTISDLTSANTLLTWSGSTTGAQSLNCARDPQIPTDKPALFITQLLVR